ncbi:MAG: helix-turn-helix domain-containing protein [Promethearchaeota archaeon]
MADLWQDLQELQLSESSSKVLEQLIRSPTALSGNELAHHSKITRYYVFEILRRLDERKFLETIPSRPRRYRFDPFSIDRLLQQLNDQLQQFKSPNFNEVSSKELLNLTKNEFCLIDIKDHSLTVQKAGQKLPHLSQTKVRTLIRSLVRRGLIEAVSGTRPRQYRPASLARLVEQEKQRQIQILKNRVHRIEEIKSKIANLSVKSSPYEETGEILLLQGQQILEKVTRILRESRDICLARSTSSFSRSLSNEQLKKIIVELTRASLKAAQRGARARLILGMELLEPYLSLIPEQNLKEILFRYPNLQIRVTDRKFPSIDILDTRVFIEYLSVIPGSAMYVEGRGPASAKQALFEEMWHACHEFRLLTRGKLNPVCEKIVEKSLIEYPPYIPFPAFEPKDISISYSYKSAVDAIRAFISKAQNRVAMVFLLDLANFPRKVVTKIINIWNTIAQQSLPSITFDIILSEKMRELLIPQLKLPEETLATINVRSWALTGSMGVFMIIDETTFVMPSLERAEEEEWTFLATSNAIMVRQTVQIFENLWEVCQQVNINE